jgi:hypothetical protein
MQNSAKDLIVPAAQQVVALGLPSNLSGFARFAAADDGDFPGDLLKVNGKSGRITFGSQEIELPRGSKFAVLLGQAKAGWIRWQGGQREGQAWLRLADADADLDALRQSLGDTNPDEWTEFKPSGLPKDSWSMSILLPVIHVKDGKLMTLASSSVSTVKAVRRLVRNCLMVVARNPETTAGHVPVVALGVKSYRMNVGEVFYATFEVEDWIPESDALHMLGKHGNAEAFGVNNAEAVNADLGPELTVENTGAVR